MLLLVTEPVSGVLNAVSLSNSINNSFTSLFKLKDTGIESRTQIGVRNLAAAHKVQHFCVLVALVFLELVNSQLSVVDSNKVDQLAGVLKILVLLLNHGLESQDLFLFAALAHEKVFQRGFA